MTAAQWVFVGLIVLGGLYWLLSALSAVWIIRRVPVLEHLRPREPESWPKLSVIIPACNEADSIEAATKSRLTEGYPSLEIVLVNDRSDDATGEIIDRLAAADPRVRALHITALPDGWLGKVHALHRGVEAATGEWLLFSDADVHVEPDTLGRTVAYCEQRGFDHLAVIPQLWPASFLLGCVLASFVRLACLGARPWAIENPKSNVAIGVGAFNLVRRSAFEKTGGFGELKLTVIDDMALAQVLKRSGAKGTVVNGRRHVGLYFYRTLAEAARATEKSVLVAFQFSYVRLAAVMLAVLWCELSPIVALVTLCFAAGRGLGSLVSAGTATLPEAGLGGGALSAIGGLGVGGLLLALFSALLINRWVRMPLLPAALFPVGLLVNVVLVARAAVLAAWRGGHMWRGVLYPTDILRAENRFRYP